MLGKIFEPFVNKSPVSVMARGLAERILQPQKLDSWFENLDTLQYTRDLLFSSVFNLMSQVVCGSQKSVNAAYQAAKDEVSTSDVFPCEDGHAQERSLLGEVLKSVAPRDVWVADRNFCTLMFLLGIDKPGGYFVIREHKNLPWESISDIRPVGKTDTGKLFEHKIQITDEHGKTLKGFGNY